MTLPAESACTRTWNFSAGFLAVIRVPAAVPPVLLNVGTFPRLFQSVFRRLLGKRALGSVAGRYDTAVPGSCISFPTLSSKKN